jgi:hypothetical protein
MSSILQEKIQDYSDFLKQARQSLSSPDGFDKSIKAKKLAIRSPLSVTDDSPTGYTVGCDWLQLTINPEPGKHFDKLINENKADIVIQELLDLFSELIPNQDWLDKPGKYCYGKTYYNKAVSSGVITIQYNLPADIPEYSTDKPSISISIPGSICGQLSLEQILGLIAYFQSIGKVKFTRFDTALDDYTKSINFDDIFTACTNKGVRGYRKPVDIQLGILTTLSNKRFGWSFTWGDGGDKELQIYDKESESLGRIRSIRLESRHRDDYADDLVNKLMEDFDYDNSMLYLYNVEKFTEDFINKKIALMAGAVNGCISFVESGQEKCRKSRCKVLSWWENHIENTAKSIKIKAVTRPLTTLPDKLFNKIRCAKSDTKLMRFFALAITRIKDNQFTFESFMNLLSCIGSGRLTQADNREINTWVDTWGSSSENFDKLLEYAGVYEA